MRRVLLAGLLVGCRPADDGGLTTRVGVLTDTGEAAVDPTTWLSGAWRQVMADCPEPVGNMASFEETNATWEVVRADVECAQTIREHFGLALGPDVLEGYESYLIVIAYYLAHRDLGTLDEMDARVSRQDSFYFRPPLVEELRRIADQEGYDSVNAALYDLVAASIETTLVVEETWSDGDSVVNAYMEGRALTIRRDQLASEFYTNPLLVHEATHAWLDLRHVACPEGTYNGFTDYSGRVACDETWRSPYGFAGGLAALYSHTIPEGASDDYMDWVRSDPLQALADARYLILENDNDLAPAR